MTAADGLDSTPRDASFRAPSMWVAVALVIGIAAAIGWGERDAWLGSGQTGGGVEIGRAHV